MPVTPAVRTRDDKITSGHNESTGSGFEIGLLQHRPNKLIHVAIFGLGHRLIRTAAAWHLAQRVGLTKFKFQWGSCGKENSTELSIFSYLFGNDEWELPTLQLNALSIRQLRKGRNALVRNDVYGYLPAQTFQDHRIPLDESVYKHSPTSPFQSKLSSDIQLYQQIKNRFVFRESIDEFMKQHRFHDHTVIGIHLRAGNGEEQHFSYAGRHITNEIAFVSNLIDLVRRFLIVGATDTSNKQALIFLATDTAYLIPILSNLTQHFSVPTVVFPQIRVPDHEGVTFSALSGAGKKCLQGWQAMVADMILLSEVDILIAARHSSFTQSMPISLVLERKKQEKGPHFCEVSDSAMRMSCFQDIETWLYRDELSKQWMYVLPSASTDETGQVRHKSLIHLPDKDSPKEYDHLLHFLIDDNIPTSSVDSMTHTYGSKRFNPKYRNRKPSLISGWNFTSASRI